MPVGDSSLPEWAWGRHYLAVKASVKPFIHSLVTFYRLMKFVSIGVTRDVRAIVTQPLEFGLVAVRFRSALKDFGAVGIESSRTRALQVPEINDVVSNVTWLSSRLICPPVPTLPRPACAPCFTIKGTLCNRFVCVSVSVSVCVCVCVCVVCVVCVCF